MRLSQEAMEGIAREVLAAYNSVPKRGAETGGLLLGSEVDSGVSVRDFEPIICSHRFGPSFVLDDQDHQELADSMAFFAKNPEALPVVGVYRSHTRNGEGLDERDRELLARYFPNRPTRMLLLRPLRSQTIEAEAWNWNGADLEPLAPPIRFPFADGVIGNGAVPVEPQPGAAPAEPAPAPAPRLRKPAHDSSFGTLFDELVAEADATEARQSLPAAAPEPAAPPSAPLPVADPEPPSRTVAEPPPARPPLHSHWWLRAVAALLTVSGAFLGYRSARSSPQAAPLPAAPAPIVASQPVTLPPPTPTAVAEPAPPVEVPKAAEPEAPPREAKADKPDKAAQADKPEKADKAAQAAKAEKAERAKKDDKGKRKKRAAEVEEAAANAPADPDAEIREVLSGWSEAHRAGEATDVAGFYATEVARYRAHRGATPGDVSRAVADSIRRRGVPVIFRLTDVKVQVAGEDRATATFRKHWQTKGERMQAGEEDQRITLVREDGRWKIASEDEPKVLWTHDLK